MINKDNVTITTIICFFILWLTLVLGVNGCDMSNQKKGGKYLTSATGTMDTNPLLQGIINIVDYDGEVLFEKTRIRKKSKINHAGKLKAIDAMSWVDIEFLGGEKARLVNGALDIGFGEISNATAGLPIGDGSGTNPNVRKIKLESGELFLHMAKSEQLRKVRYYFSTNMIYIDVQTGTFVVKAQQNNTQISVCSGQVAIGPSYAIAPEHRPKWPEMKMTSGNKVSVNLAGVPTLEEMQEAEKRELSDTIVNMKGSCGGS